MLYRCPMLRPLSKYQFTVCASRSMGVPFVVFEILVSRFCLGFADSQDFWPLRGEVTIVQLEKGKLRGRGRDWTEMGVDKKLQEQKGGCSNKSKPCFWMIGSCLTCPALLQDIDSIQSLWLLSSLIEFCQTWLHEGHRKLSHADELLLWIFAAHTTGTSELAFEAHIV